MVDSELSHLRAKYSLGSGRDKVQIWVAHTGRKRGYLRTGTENPSFSRLCYRIWGIWSRRSLVLRVDVDAHNDDDLSFNNITGFIPSCLGMLSNSLSLLNLKGNNLQGTIPNTFTNERKLRMTSISESKMKGHIPRSFENSLAQLHVLSYSSPKFYDVVRFSSKSNYNFPKLRIIDLSYNSFSGDLPQQYFQEWLAMKEIHTTAEYMQREISITQEDNNVVYNSEIQIMHETNKANPMSGTYAESLDCIRIHISWLYKHLASPAFHPEVVP
ncbi:leucine-rich repeat domain, L domain-like protein [Artemisia annua]|uniref:Leucine-rich repeat domain, L domain-like protein n=1 Tax=Artemisia annua TaxID=35608 RepID=A0A2U1LKN3_ARTAN|nr:leucine-rich repeat domain, L domain-like protein [Artemisia annua]